MILRLNDERMSLETTEAPRDHDLCVRVTAFIIKLTSTILTMVGSTLIHLFNAAGGYDAAQLIVRRRAELMC